MKRTFI